MTNMKFKSWTDSRQTEAQLITPQQQPLDSNETDYISKPGTYSKVSIISTGRSRLLEFEIEIVLVV